MGFLKHNLFKNRKLTASADISESGFLHLDGEGVIVDEEGELVEFTEEQEEKLLGISGFEKYELKPGMDGSLGMTDETELGKKNEELLNVDGEKINPPADQEHEQEEVKEKSDAGNTENEQAQTQDSLEAQKTSEANDAGQENVIQSQTGGPTEEVKDQVADLGEKIEENHSEQSDQAAEEKPKKQRNSRNKNNSE